MKCAAFALAAAIGLAFVPTPAKAESTLSVAGLWLNPEQGWIVEYAACGTGMCGTLVSFRNGNAPEHAPRDRRNPDRAKRTAPLCGLLVVHGFVPSPGGAGKWEGGWIYDPQTGGTYQGLAELVGADTIKLRGYLMSPLLGRTVTLVRVTGAIERCALPADEAETQAAARSESFASNEPADSRAR